MVVLLQAVMAAVAVAQPQGPLYRDSSAPVNSRVDDLLGRMTVEEKVAQVQ